MISCNLNHQKYKRNTSNISECPFFNLCLGAETWGFISVFGKFSYVTFYADRSVRTSHNSAANLATLALYLASFQFPLATFFQKKQLFLVLLETFGDSDMKARIIFTLLSEQQVLPCPLPRPKDLTGGSVLEQQSLPAAVGAGDVQPYASILGK